MPVTFDIVAEGLSFPEGPIAMEDGSVLVVEIRSGVLSRVRPDGAVQRIAHLGGGPNGAAIGPEGAIYVCNNGGLEFHEIGGLVVPGHMPADYVGGSIQRVDHGTGAAETVYDACDGKQLRGPNDIVFDGEGGFWFTDLGKSDAWSRDNGFVCYATTDGRRIERARGGFIGPNGIALSPDQRVLYVAETFTGRLWALDIARPGALAPPASPFSPGRLVATLPGHEYPDSLAVDAMGCICVAAGPTGGIFVVSPDGDIELRRIPGEVIVTNICFGGDDMRTAWITASSSGRLYKTRWDAPGLRLNFSA